MLQEADTRNGSGDRRALAEIGQQQGRSRGKDQEKTQ
jgi:hypothetical protein